MERKGLAFLKIVGVLLAVFIGIPLVCFLLFLAGQGLFDAVGAGTSQTVSSAKSIITQGERYKQTLVTTGEMKSFVSWGGRLALVVLSALAAAVLVYFQLSTTAGGRRSKRRRKRT